MWNWNEFISVFCFFIQSFCVFCLGRNVNASGMIYIFSSNNQFQLIGELSGDFPIDKQKEQKQWNGLGREKKMFGREIRPKNEKKKI